MPSQQRRSDRKRTAILVVHGMGSQRPFDTVRGVVEAIWLEGQNPKRSGKRMWTHPEQRGADIDLPVITTDSIPRVDFHEVYWAHLMSETRAVAVLLWLFELARRGPRLKRSIRALYWGILSFLALLVLSVSLLAIQFIILFVENAARVTTGLPIDVALLLLVVVSLVTFFVLSCLITAAAISHGAIRLAGWGAVTTAIAFLLFVVVLSQKELFEDLTNVLLPILVALVAVKITMRWWGVLGLGIAYGFSALAFVGLSYFFPIGVCERVYCWPWSITAFWSSIAAWFFIAIYLVSYALFLQPYLGDAARYFRKARLPINCRRSCPLQSS
jgi:hypothetical protein